MCLPSNSFSFLSTDRWHRIPCRGGRLRGHENIRTRLIVRRPAPRSTNSTDALLCGQPVSANLYRLCRRAGTATLSFQPCDVMTGGNRTLTIRNSRLAHSPRSAKPTLPGHPVMPSAPIAPGQAAGATACFPENSYGIRHQSGSIKSATTFRRSRFCRLIRAKERESSLFARENGQPRPDRAADYRGSDKPGQCHS